MSKKLDSSPNGAWRLGNKIESPVQCWVTNDFSKLTATDAYKLLIGSVVPRPIAFVSTVDADGIGNLAPFSFFNAVSSDPACVVISLTRKPDGRKKDTLVNIEATGELVVNSVAEWMVEPMNQCSGDYPHGVDEMAKVGLTPLDSVLVRPNRVKESPIQMECNVHQLVEIGSGDPGSATLVIARVRMIHVFDEALSQGRIDIEKIKPISRLAGSAYGMPPDRFELDRPRITQDT